MNIFTILIIAILAVFLLALLIGLCITADDGDDYDPLF
jgi:hypothetical protein